MAGGLAGGQGTLAKGKLCPSDAELRGASLELACETGGWAQPAPTPESPPPPQAVLTRARAQADPARQEGAGRVWRLCGHRGCVRSSAAAPDPVHRALLSHGPRAAIALGSDRRGWGRAPPASASWAARGAQHGVRQAGRRPGVLGARPALGRLAGVKPLTRAPSPVLSPRGEQDLTAQRMGAGAGPPGVRPGAAAPWPWDPGQVPL